MSGRTRLLVAALAAVVGVGGARLLVGAGNGPGPDVRTLVAGAADPVALVALDDGGLRYAERLSGRVREVSGDGRLRPSPVAEVAVGTGGQRGLLGLAVDGRDRTFAAWTDPAGVLVVGQVAPGRRRVVWRGPVTARLGNGGHLELSPDGRLVVGIGDLQAPGRVADPGAPHGKLLALDPAAGPDQTPAVLSSGWNNPFAFAFTPAGSLWVADNAPGSGPERLARVGPGGEPAAVTELPGPQRAPAGLVALSEEALVLCAYLSGELTLHRVGPDGRAEARGRRLAGDCRTGVAVLAGGDLAYAAEDAIRVVQAPVP